MQNENMVGLKMCVTTKIKATNSNIYKSGINESNNNINVQLKNNSSLKRVAAVKLHKTVKSNSNNNNSKIKQTSEISCKNNSKYNKLTATAIPTATTIKIVRATSL
ncbi:unnamed protein product [Ceratitis capitata]|uniref:(Mediterranean fruit fly) hypothetical protein n=1 Tax=Ceratitis capitata TaxID=7213 RepID=A0A811TZM7_CERCA|nr:unnamed protein product [Ceratitis capitata]